MRTVSVGDSLHEMSNPVSGKNKLFIIYLSSAEMVQRVVNFNKDYPLVFSSSLRLFHSYLALIVHSRPRLLP